MSGLSRTPKPAEPRSITPSGFIGPTGILIDPTLELSQPGGPFPAGFVIQTDGLGAYVIASPLTAPSISTVFKEATDLFRATEANVLITSETGDDMAMTLGAGRYLVRFSATWRAGVKGKAVSIQIWTGETPVAASRRETSRVESSVCASEAQVTITDSQSIEVRATGLGADKACELLERTMTILYVGAE